jgi:hypothetical protein
MAEQLRTDATASAVVMEVGVKRISWPAIFAGVVMAIVIQVVLGMLGTAIGMSTIDPLEGESPGMKTFSVAAGLWWTVASWVSLFFGGWVAGHVAGIPDEMDSILHGLLTWALGTVLALFVAGSVVGTIVSGVSGMAGNAVLVGASTAGAAGGAAGGTIAGARTNQSDAQAMWADIKREARGLLQNKPEQSRAPEAKGASAPDTKAAAAPAPMANTSDSEFDSALERLLNRGRDNATQTDRDAVINGVVTRGGMSREDAARRVDTWESSAQQQRVQTDQQRQQAKQRAKEVADATAKVVSRAALFGFVAILLGGIAAAVGAALGRPHNIVRARAL